MNIHWNTLDLSSNTKYFPWQQYNTISNTYCCFESEVEVVEEKIMCVSDSDCSKSEIKRFYLRRKKKAKTFTRLSRWIALSMKGHRKLPSMKADAIARSTLDSTDSPKQITAFKINRFRHKRTKTCKLHQQHAIFFLFMIENTIQLLKSIDISIIIIYIKLTNKSIN